MSRSRNGMFPAIKAPPADGEDNWGATPRAESRSLMRIDQLEDRLSYQERTSQSLLDRAYKIKEDVIDNLSITHGSWNEEKRARELLQEHIRTITDVVRKLGKDILYLEDQVRVKEGMADGATSAVKNLEVHHVAGLTDLRGRVGRCDASIARLSSDLKSCFESIQTLNHQQMEESGKLASRMTGLDNKLSTVLNRLDKMAADQDIGLRQVDSDSSHKVTALDAKTRVLLEETKVNLSSIRAQEESERERMESRVGNSLEKALTHRDMVTERLDMKLDDSVNLLNRKIQKVEENLSREKEHNTTVYKVLEQKVSEHLDQQAKKQTEDLARLKRECRSGFGTVHESISNMKEVVEGKRRILEEQLRKEIGNIRKMVVLV